MPHVAKVLSQIAEAAPWGEPYAPVKSSAEDNAIACVSEHLEYFAVVAQHAGIDPAYRERVARVIVAAVQAIVRGAR